MDAPSNTTFHDVVADAPQMLAFKLLVQAAHRRLKVQLQMKENPVPAALAAVRKTASQVACIHKPSADH